MENQTKKQKTLVETFDLRAFLYRLIKNWYLFALSLLIAYGYAYYKVRYSPNIYSTYAKVLVKSEYSSWGQEYFLRGLELVSARNTFKDEIGIILSYNLNLRALSKVDFGVFYYDIGQIRSTELYNRSPFRVFMDSLSMKELMRKTFYVKILNGKQYKLHRSKENIDKAPVRYFDRWEKVGRAKIKNSHHRSFFFT